MFLQSAALVGGLLLGLSYAQSSSSPKSTTPSTSPPPPTADTFPPEPWNGLGGTWSVRTANQTCVILKGNFSFVVNTNTRDGDTVTDRVDIPTSATVQGRCGPFVNVLVLTWPQGNLTFLFIKRPVYVAGNDTGTGSYTLTGVFGSVTTPNAAAANASGPHSYIAVRETDFMNTPLGYSYSCDSYESVLTSKNGNSYLEMTDIQVQAFHDGVDDTFGENTICTKDTLSSVLPILGYSALGVAAAGGLGYLAWMKFGRGAGYAQV